MFSSISIWRWLALSSACVFTTSPVEAVPVFSDIYVLGDSLSDQGNLFDATATLTGAGIPASDHYYDGRFSNGEVYSGLLARRLGLTLTATLRGGNNFAYGGTRTAYNIVENPPSPGGFMPGSTGYAWTLNLQRAAFAARHVFDPNALYVVFSGSNDVADLIGPARTGGFGSTAARSAAAVQGILDVVTAYKVAGARNILVPNAPDLGVVPSVTNFGSSALSGLATALSRRYNSELDAALNAVSGVEIIRFDTFGFVDQVHDHPADFGFTNVTQACYSGFVSPAASTDTVCGSPQSYAYWDKEHPTTALQSILADHLLAAVEAAVVPEPESYTLVVVALAALWLTRRHGNKAPATCT